jgi:hypothetical protein
MNKTFLDNFVILYSENKNKNFIELLQTVNNEPSTKNVWSISSLKNIRDTDHIVNQKVINLPSEDNFLLVPNLVISEINLVANNLGQSIKKSNLKSELIDYAFPFLYDYIKEYELSIKKIKNFTIYEQIESSDFHDDLDRDGQKHFYTIVIALNDNYAGGEFQFENRVGNEIISLSAGDVLIYPANKNYRHRELRVTSGTKYTAIAYF